VYADSNRTKFIKPDIKK